MISVFICARAAESAFGVVSSRYLALGDNFVLVLLDCAWAQLLQHLLLPHVERTPAHLADATSFSSAASPAVPSPTSPSSPSATSASPSSAAAAAALRSPAAHRAAYERLERAKSLLRELHGEGLQRLSGRDDANQQRAVYVRLHLLQGALAFVGGELDDAKSLLTKADAMRQQLTIGPEDEEKLASLHTLGLSRHAARAALLFCNKDVQAAAAHGLEKLAQQRAQRERKERDKQLEEAYGLTAKGLVVNGVAMEQVASMGYELTLAAEALRRCENDTEAAVCMLCDPLGHEAVLLGVMQRQSKADAAGGGAAGGSRAHSAASASGTPVDPQQLSTLCEMGFAAEQAAAALRGTGHDVAAAALALGRGEYADTASPMDVTDGAEGSSGAGGSGASGGKLEEEGGSASASPPALAPPRMTDEEYAAVHAAEMRSAIAASERAYKEASLRDEGAVLQYLLGKLS